MKNLKIGFIVVCGFALFIFVILSIQNQSFVTVNFGINEQDEIYSIDLSSESTNVPYGSLEPYKKRFIQETRAENNETFSADDFDRAIASFNENLDQANIPNEADGIDLFLSTLPKSFRRHFSLVHRSFSIQNSTPHTPRVIMYGRDAQVMLTFNGGVDETGKKLGGGDTIEVIKWIPETKSWKFSELEFDETKKITQKQNIAKCVMCHAGTPKPVDMVDADKYFDELKPIFPQYPFWPGFYGSINDVVGIDEAAIPAQPATKDKPAVAARPASKDTITRYLPATIKQIKDLTFSSTEELFRLREFLDQPNSKYLKVVENELNVHLKYFKPFIESIPNRSRYRNLVLITDSYRSKNEKIPESLRSAPYRRTFDKEYGHYLLRPNFYLTTLLAAYQAQVIADRISKSSVFEQIKFSFLYKKLSCGSDLVVDGLSTKELNPSFDLIYPNQSSEDVRNKQYLLAYQYNVVQAQKGGSEALPLHTWNLEGNEDIASYHYGNVYADLNELVLWNLVTKVFPGVGLETGRDAAEKRHYEFSDSDYFKKPLGFAKSYVSRMSADQMKQVSSFQTYSDSEKKYMAMPVSTYCSSTNGVNSLKNAAALELKKLAVLKSQGKLPHQVYQLNEKFFSESDISTNGKYKMHLVRQACESCHATDSTDSDRQINPSINVNWFSNSYFIDLHEDYESIDPGKSGKKPLLDHIRSVLDVNELPVPFGQRMPYGRKPFDQISLVCENIIIENSAKLNRKLNYSEIFQCGTGFPLADPNSLNCKCAKLILNKDKLYKEIYMRQ